MSLLEKQSRFVAPCVPGGTPQRCAKVCHPKWTFGPYLAASAATFADPIIGSAGWSYVTSTFRLAEKCAGVGVYRPVMRPPQTETVLFPQEISQSVDHHVLVKSTPDRRSPLGNILLEEFY